MLSEPHLFDQLTGLTWPARRVVRSGPAGTHTSRLRGAATEFTEYRPYRQGDDPRRLDWKLLARTNRAFLRITSDRATFRTLFVLDASASMAYPAGADSKWTHACRLVLGLASVARASGDPVGLRVAHPDGVRQVALRTRRSVLAQMTQVLSTVEPMGTVSLAPVVAALPPAARIVIASDFLDDGDDLVRLARERVLAGSELYALHIVARNELDPPDRAILATDPEKPDLRRSLTAETREAYVRAFAEWRQATARAWRAAGTHYLEMPTDEPAAQAVRRVTREGVTG